MIKLSLTLLILGLSATNVFCQKETYNWFFGQNAGLNFNSGAPVFQPGSLVTKEGCATISDKDGNLLFYTDGRTVWNRNHTAMPNGTGLMAGVDGSTTQAALIVPHPGNDSIFYLFTVDQAENISTNKGFRYSIVNMKLDGGAGDVTAIKNVQLLPIYEKEMIAGIRHGNGKDVWVLAHNSSTNEFEEFLINSNGLNTTPRTIPIGSTFYKYQEYGYLKFSPDGKKLAAAYSGVYVEIFDFDVNTGNISNPRILTDLGNNGYCSNYGVEFSCDSKFLYVTELFDCTIFHTQGYNLLQYNTDLPTAADIINSRVVIDASTTAKPAGALQMGPDGKIYITYYDESFLGVISKPGVAGTGCGYIKQYVNLPAPALAKHGLPNFIQSYFNIPVDFSAANNCISSTVNFTLSNMAVDSVRWDFGDPVSGLANTSLLKAPIHTFSRSGIYTVKAIAYRNCRNDTIEKIISAGEYTDILGRDTSLCENEKLILRATVPGGATYAWQNASVADTFLVNTAGKYKVAITLRGCTLIDSILVDYKPNPVASLVSDMGVCENRFPFTMGGVLAGAGYLWNTGATSPSIQISAPGLYWREVTVNGCFKRDTVTIAPKPVTGFSLGNDTTICQYSPLNLAAGSFSSYVWSNGSNTSNITVTRQGIYWCDATNQQGCTSRDSIIVSEKPIPVFALNNDTTICENTSLLLDVTGAGDSYEWQDRSTQPAFLVEAKGKYFVTVTTNNCSSSDTVNISVLDLPRPNLGNNLDICFGETIILDPNVSDTLPVQWQNGSSQPTFTVTTAGLYSVTVTNSCGAATDEINVELVPCSVSFPNAFSPNGNNRFFRALHTHGISQFRLQVFNRFGQPVFTTTDPLKGWDGTYAGKSQPVGTYVWYAVYTDNAGKKITRKGTVTLVK